MSGDHRPDPSVAVVELDDPAEEATLAELARTVTERVERQSAFALVLILPAPLDDSLEGAEPLRVLRRRRAEVGTWCRGVVYVLPKDRADRWSPGDRANAANLWGCAIEATDDLAAACRWGRDRVSAG